MTDDEELLAAFQRQEVLVAKVEALKTSNRTLKVIVALLLAVVIMVGGIANWARVTAERVKANTSADQVQRDADALVACRLRNGANASVRDQFARFNDALAALVTSPNGQAAIASLRASVPTAQEQDRDCDANGQLDSADYPS